MPVSGSAATQSPTAGRSAAVAAAWRSRPDGAPASGPVRGGEVEPPAVHCGDAGGDQVGSPERREGGGEGGGPAEDGEGAVRMKR